MKYNASFVNTLVIFLISTFIIISLFPGQSKFKYEFKKGGPWQQENLIAPFNIPIFKTKEQIKEEQNKLLINYKPYFVIDESIYNEQLKKLSSHFNELWEELNTTLKEDLHLQKDLKLEVDSLLKKEFHDIYKTGILASENFITYGLKKIKSINIITQNRLSVRNTEELLTPLQAYQKVKNNILDSIKDVTKIEFIKKLRIDNYIYPNLDYEQKTSGYEKQKLIDLVSTTHGLIQTGTLIIAKGEFITPEKYTLLQSFQKEFEKQAGSKYNYIFVAFGQAILIIISMICLFLYMNHSNQEIITSKTNTIFIMLMVILFTFLTRVTLNADTINIYVLPFVILPIVIKTFFDSRIAFFTFLITIITIAYMVPQSYKFILLQLITGAIAVFIIKKIYSRKDLSLVAVYSFLTYSLIYFGTSVIEEGALNQIEWNNFMWFAINGLLILISYPLIYIFEKTFGFISDLTLLELSDTNRPLLRQLTEKTPGTFQHSMIMANLAEEAIRKIGGNPLLIRTAALYHDIGKINNPQYFVENQGGGKNPHDELGFEESAQIIIKHVTDGLEIAKKNNLPKQLIDFIITHHGTTKVQYFYRSFINQYPDTEVNEQKFTYPGIKPFSKETAVLMMADSIEAATRSLKEKTVSLIDNMVDKIINYQFEEEQFSNANITFKDITEVKKIFKQKLANIYHARIEYPQDSK